MMPGTAQAASYSYHVLSYQAVDLSSGSKLSCLLQYAKGDEKKRGKDLTLMVPDDGFQHIIEV